MALDLADLSDDVLAFLADRHLAVLAIPRAEQAPHATPVGFTYDADTRVARVITWAGSQKTRLLETPRQVSVSQVDGGRWLTLEGVAEVKSDPESCAEGERRYSQRYRPPKDRGSDRRVIEIQVTKMMGRA